MYTHLTSTVLGLIFSLPVSINAIKRNTHRYEPNSIEVVDVTRVVFCVYNRSKINILLAYGKLAPTVVKYGRRWWSFVNWKSRYVLPR